MKELPACFSEICNPTLIIFFGHGWNVVMVDETSFPNVPSNQLASFEMKVSYVSDALNC